MGRTLAKQLAGLMLLLVATLYSVLSEAGGGAGSPPSSGDDPAGQQAMPIRSVEVQAVNTQAFRLPNGKPVDLTADLNRMLQTVVANSNLFVPFEPAEDLDRGCGRYLKLEANVNTVDLGVASLGIRFGYSDSNTIGNPIEIDGELDVTIGRISMAFRVLECNQEGCRAPIGKFADHLTTDLSLDFKVNLGDINSGGDFLFKTALGKIMQDIMENGVRKLESDFQKIHRLSWVATVKAVDPEAGTVIFDAGNRDGLHNNELFEVFARESRHAARCDAFRPLAIVRTESVNTASSIARQERILNSREIQVGDIVMVHTIKR